MRYFVFKEVILKMTFENKIVTIVDYFTNKIATFTQIYI